jgi:hypothetical protein
MPPTLPIDWLDDSPPPPPADATRVRTALAAAGREAARALDRGLASAAAAYSSPDAAPPDIAAPWRVAAEARDLAALVAKRAR